MTSPQCTELSQRFQHYLLFQSMIECPLILQQVLCFLSIADLLAFANTNKQCALLLRLPNVEIRLLRAKVSFLEKKLLAIQPFEPASDDTDTFNQFGLFMPRVTQHPLSLLITRLFPSKRAPNLFSPHATANNHPTNHTRAVTHNTNYPHPNSNPSAVAKPNQLSSVRMNQQANQYCLEKELQKSRSKEEYLKSEINGNYRQYADPFSPIIIQRTIESDLGNLIHIPYMSHISQMNPKHFQSPNDYRRDMGQTDQSYLDYYKMKGRFWIEQDKYYQKQMKNKKNSAHEMEKETMYRAIFKDEMRSILFSQNNQKHQISDLYRMQKMNELAQKISYAKKINEQIKKADKYSTDLQYAKLLEACKSKYGDEQIRQMTYELNKLNHLNHQNPVIKPTFRQIKQIDYGRSKKHQQTSKAVSIINQILFLPIIGINIVPSVCSSMIQGIYSLWS